MLSTARWQKYLDAVDGRPEAAWPLYQWNLEMAGNLFEPLHWLEVGLRNAVHQTLSDRAERADWWLAIALDYSARRKIDESTHRLRGCLVRSPCPDDIVANLSLGFWVSLIAKKYARTLWVPGLYRAFRPGYRGTRHVLHADLNAVLRLRNRVMHHEPIYGPWLAADVVRIERLIQYVAAEVLNQPACMKRARDTLALRPTPTRLGGPR